MHINSNKTVIESTEKEIKIRIAIILGSSRRIKIHMEIPIQHNFKEELIQSRGRICFIIRL